MLRHLFLLVGFLLSAVTVCAQRISDGQVVAYVRQAHVEGRPQQQIADGLLRRGVTQEQLLRLHTLATTYGRELFNNPDLSFEPNVNLPVPPDYRLGTGDEVVMELWGATRLIIRRTISPEGDVRIDGLGPVRLEGLTVEEAGKHLMHELSSIYAGLGGASPDTFFRLTLGDARTIRITVVGEVRVPGTYRLSAYASLLQALYQAGGANDIGSLRAVQLVRAGERMATLDVYDYLMNEAGEVDVRLQDGDMLLVPPYRLLVEVEGFVKRPMRYELASGETLADLLRYAGGLRSDAYEDVVRVIRKSGRQLTVHSVDAAAFDTFPLHDGDRVQVEGLLNRFENRVQVAGAVLRPGTFQLGDSLTSVKALIARANGLRGDAFLNRAVLNRRREDLTHELLAFHLGGLMEGTVPDIPLQPEDFLYIPSAQELREEQVVRIQGEVLHPGTFAYADRMTLKDLILQAGGFTEAASTARIGVTRRIKRPATTEYTGRLGETFTIDLQNGLQPEDSSEAFRLQPFDVVQVRRSPSYQEQRMVTVAGEVLFSGNYALESKQERLSTLVARAGGLSRSAYAGGARLLRLRNEGERYREETLQRLARRTASTDSLTFRNLDISPVYAVGFDLERALALPGGPDDLILRAGDMLYIPTQVSTVKIGGAVMHPNTVAWKAGAGLKHYIEMAGGYETDAAKGKIFIVYLNGTVARADKNNPEQLRPGCEVVVPGKSDRPRQLISELSQLGNTMASAALLVAALTKLL